MHKNQQRCWNSRKSQPILTLCGRCSTEREIMWNPLWIHRIPPMLVCINLNYILNSELHQFLNLSNRKYMRQKLLNSEEKKIMEATKPFAVASWKLVASSTSWNLMVCLNTSILPSHHGSTQRFRLDFYKEMRETQVTLDLLAALPLLFMRERLLDLLPSQPSLTRWNNKDPVTHCKKARKKKIWQGTRVY